MYVKHDIDWSHVIEDYERLLSTLKVSAEYGCDEATVYYHLKKRGYTLPPRKGRVRDAAFIATMTEVNRRPDKRAAAGKGALKRFERMREANTWTPTVIEQKLSDALVRARVSHKTQWTIGRYVADVLLDEAPVVIEADGFHHRLATGQERDRKRDAYLAEAGYAVFHFDGEQINADADWCVAQVLAAVSVGTTPGPVRVESGNRKGNHHPMYGRKHSSEAKRKMRAAKARQRMERQIVLQSELRSNA